ncbi:Dolichyl-diphosphooligosaccharide--protein glycosyltransferase subunit SWP1 [Hanseniaspora osmophila]|uniref:Dolichyl-diphosphooligosaccharide--protein glycosyltransferase subunit SWP1 n=1 Tax=Hanseniaspora osmophila TaxID=56408 RepID=A0A1E5RNH6_9ASCO|nr:Dolichyl-diphosphooligosaccharide--protein glycosyltransferase subunit SWP1 [Hanseniaspora osmophila]
MQLLSWIYTVFVAVSMLNSANAITNPQLLAGTSKQFLDLSQGPQKITLDYNTNDLLKFQFEYIPSPAPKTNDEQEDAPIVANTKPQHASLVLSVDNKIEQPYMIKSSKDNVYSWLLQSSQLPNPLVYYSTKWGKPISGKLYFKSAEEAIVNELFFEIEFDKTTISDQTLSSLIVEAPEQEKKNSVKPEIIHQFHAPPKQANKFIVSIFIVAVLLGALFTLVSWFAAIDFSKNHITLRKQCGTLVYLAGFLVGILGLEFSFFQYYLGNNDIFRTLYNVFVLFTLPTMYAGAKLLKRLY